MKKLKIEIDSENVEEKLLISSYFSITLCGVVNCDEMYCEDCPANYIQESMAISEALKFWKTIGVE